MSPDNIQAFRTSDMHSVRHGLGLEIVKDTVTVHGGHWELISRPGLTRFTLIFPQALMTSAPASEPAGPARDRVPDPPRSPFIYVDPDLFPLVEATILDAERGSFQFTCERARLHEVCLLISRDDSAIEFALQHDIPILLSATQERAWIPALKSRLRLWNRVRALRMS